MSRLTRTIRALILALVLPALLVPSGWSAHLCLCGVISTASTDSCCPSEQAELESLDACCSQGRSGVAAGATDCGQDDCEGCCRIVEADGVELVFASPTEIALPAAALETLQEAPSTPPTPRGRALRACTHSLAPPRASSPLPLRI